MCRLFALMATAEVDLEISLLDAPREFHALGQANPDGWGLGFFPQGQEAAPSILKQALPAEGELAPEQAEARGEGRLFLAHVRRGSRAPRARHNCHPFTHDGWLFAQNGALFPLLEKWVRSRVGAVKYEGHTESEALFRWILLNIEKAGRPEEGIRAAVEPLLADRQFSSLNFLLARPNRLYAFRYAARSADYFTLYYLDRPPGGELGAVSRDVFSRLRSRALARQRAVLVASEALTPEPWQALGMGQLLCVRDNLEIEVVSLSPAAGVHYAANR